MSHECEKMREQLVLFLYGEISFDEEEQLEAHLAGCEECRAERARLETFERLMEEGEAEVPAGLLARCRRDLAAAVAEEAAAPKRIDLGAWWRRWVVNPPMWLRPVGAVLMLAAGFFTARLVPMDSPALARIGMSQSSPAVARVRLVNTEESGRVRVAYEETREREVSGDIGDEKIRQLLLAAAVDPADAGLRVESIDILKRKCSDNEVRQALVNALRTDTNSGVRLKALEGLRMFAHEPETRKVLTQVLLTDDNPGVRTQAIDLLLETKTPEVAGVLQEVLRKEENSYVRSRSQKALSDMKASIGTF